MPYLPSSGTERSSETANDPFLVGMDRLSFLSYAVSIGQIIDPNINYRNLPLSVEFFIEWPELVDRCPFPSLGVVPLSICDLLVE